MNSTNPIQESMFLEMKEESLFSKVQQYGMDYIHQLAERNVYPSADAIKNLAIFDEELPKHTANAKDIIELLYKYGAPATVTQSGGRYFGFVCGGAVPVGLAAKGLATFWDQNTAMYVLSPLSSKLESVVERWLVNLFNLPEQTVAGFVSGTSTANFCGLAAARYRLLKNKNWDINNKGLTNAPPLRIVAGRQAHSTIHKAIGLLGFGKDNVEWVDVDDQGRIIPELIPQLDDSTILILQAGNVNSGSFDSFGEIVGKASGSKAWLHIDGAFGLWAGAVKEFNHLIKGMEKANSWAVDAHKTLNTPYDCGIVMCDDKDAIVSALHMTGSYIVLSEERDGMFFTPEMSRRSRIIELWATLKYLGRDGIAQLVNHLHQRAVQFGDELRQINGFEIVNDIVFNQVLVQCETDELTEKTLKRIQELSVCWVGGSLWHNRKVIRISVCSWVTTAEDITRSVKSFKQALYETKAEISIKGVHGS